MKYLSMFSGVGTDALAWEPLGWETVAFAEYEPFPSAVLAHRFPDVPNLGDVTKVNWSDYAGQVDLVCGGPPCQGFSVAGLRRSLEDDRGNLSLEYVRAINEINPRYTVTENVPGWLSTHDNAFGCFLAGLVGAEEPIVPDGKWASAGMVVGPKRSAAWRLLNAQYFGVPQRRRRIFVVSSLTEGVNPASILFEPQSLRGNIAPSNQAREDLAPTITRGFGDRGGDLDQIAGGGYALEPVQKLVTASSKYVPYHVAGHGSYDEGVGTLRSWGGDVGRGSENILAATVSGLRDTSTSLSTSQQRLDAETETFLINQKRVRRLTPLECERLQGLPDNHTLIPWGPRGRMAADSPRYKAIGNGWALPVARWVGQQIVRAEQEYMDHLFGLLQQPDDSDYRAWERWCEQEGDAL